MAISSLQMEERSGISYADLQWLVVCSGLETNHLQSIDNIILPVVLLCADTNATVARELGPDGAVTRVNASVVADWRLPEVREISLSSTGGLIIFVEYLAMLL